jgi:shikimate kinase
MKIILLGYMGSGKSSVGKLLASALGFNLIDLDSEIEKREGNSISELFSKKGELYFRKKENEIIKDLVTNQDDLVIAAGGGTPCYGDVIKFLTANKSVMTIYLKTNLETLTGRLFPEKDKRPLIAHIEDEVGLKDFVRKHLFERSYYYNQAKLVVDTSGLSEKEVAEKIILNLF